MDQRTIQIFFALLRSSVCEEKLTEKERSKYSPEMLPDLLSISSKQDLSHLLVDNKSLYFLRVYIHQFF